MPRDGNEIGEAVTLNRRKRAKGCATPISLLPASAPIAPEATTVRRPRAIQATTPSVQSPSVAPIEPASNGGFDGEGQDRGDTQLSAALAAIVAELVSLQRRRQFCIVSQSRGDRSIESLIASAMGYRLDGTEADRKALFARAKAFRLSVERGGEGQQFSDTHRAAALSAIAPLILASAANRKPWDDLRAAAEKDMSRLVRGLPVYEFAKQVKGFGDLALAVIQAEAGIPIGDYRTVSGLWKRMGLAVINGERQRRKKGAEAIEQAYSPRRRAEMFTFISDSMFRQQWSAERLNCPTCAAPTRFKWSADYVPVCEGCGQAPEAPDVIPAHPTGPYGEVYAQRRLRTNPRIEATADLPAKIGDHINPAKWTPARCKNDGTRIMSKALLRDMWRVWRGLPPRGADTA